MLLTSRLADESPSHLRVSELVFTSILLASVELTSRSFDGHITLWYAVKMTQRAFYELLRLAFPESFSEKLEPNCLPSLQMDGSTTNVGTLSPPTVNGALSFHLFHNERLLDFSFSAFLCSFSYNRVCTFIGQPETQLFLSQLYPAKSC